MMGFLSKKSSRELNDEIERFACDSVAQTIQATGIVKRESPDYLMQTPVGQLGLEITDLRPETPVVSADADGIRLLDAMYDTWLNNRDLQVFGINVRFLHEEPDKLKTPRPRVHSKILDEIVKICRYFSELIPNDDYRKICFRQDEVFIYHNGDVQDTLILHDNETHLYVESVLLSRHNNVLMLMPHSNLASGPRGNWPQRLRDAICSKAAKARSYREKLPPPCGLGLVVNGGTMHHGHFLGDEDELLAAAVLAERIHRDLGSPFDCLYIAGPHYVGRQFQEIATALPWKGVP